MISMASMTQISYGRRQYHDGQIDVEHVDEDPEEAPYGIFACGSNAPALSPALAI